MLNNNIYRKNSIGIDVYIYDIPDYIINQYYIVIGKPIIEPNQLYDIFPAYFQDRFIPKILKDIGVVKSTSEVKRTRPDLFISLPDDYLGFFTITLGNYMRTWITPYITFLVGPKAFKSPPITELEVLAGKSIV
jgi:hypothetical protein